jgi:hypothetical protein
MSRVWETAGLTDSLRIPPDGQEAAGLLMEGRTTTILTWMSLTDSCPRSRLTTAGKLPINSVLCLTAVKLPIFLWVAGLSFILSSFLSRTEAEQRSCLKLQLKNPVCETDTRAPRWGHLWNAWRGFRGCPKIVLPSSNNKSWRTVRIVCNQIYVGIT